jgi:flagellar motility protein MotE (MotC chaperone)
MKVARVLVLMSLAFKVVVLGTWWCSGAGPAYAAKGAEGEGTPGGAGSVPADLLDRSRGFRDLLEAVRQRGSALDQREQTVAARETALKTLEKTLADEVTRLETLTKAAGGGAPGAEGGPGGVPVTKVYESMKPDEAGPIFDKLDDQIALGILSRMKEKQIGAILAAMTRDRAVVMTRLLAETRKSAR